MTTFSWAEHHTEVQLTGCASNPFVEAWPTPQLDQEERRAETARLAGLAQAKGAAHHA